MRLLDNWYSFRNHSLPGACYNWFFQERDHIKMLLSLAAHCRSLNTGSKKACIRYGKGFLNGFNKLIHKLSRLHCIRHFMACNEKQITRLLEKCSVERKVREKCKVDIVNDIYSYMHNGIYEYDLALVTPLTRLISRQISILCKIGGLDYILDFWMVSELSKKIVYFNRD